MFRSVYSTNICMKSLHLKKIYLASPRGFCAGVARAVKIVDLVLKKHGPPIYVRHQIVHNQRVVSDFERKGVIFIEDLKNIPDESIIVFSAHGSPPSLYQLAKRKKLKLYDATCPLVTKVHLEAKRYKKEGYFIIYIGHRGHPESVGVLNEVPAQTIVLIESLEEAKKINPPQTEKLIILTQTTLSFDDTKGIINKLQKRFPNLVLPPAFDICYSTQNRQNAVKELAKKTKLILVVGSKKSSNSNRLRETAEKHGAQAYLINDYTEVKEDWFKTKKTVGITAGASTPAHLVQELISVLKSKKTQIYTLKVIKENINFPVHGNL